MIRRMPIFPLRSIVALALAASWSATAAPHRSLPGATVPDGLGVNIHFTDPMEGEMELLAGAGFRWVRMDLGWGNIERERGVFDFSAIDRLAGHLEKHHIKALFILDYSNRLYETDDSVRTEDGRKAFARWAAAAAKRYQGRGYLWEVWNEPNGSFWKPKPDPADYSALARAAATAIHEAAPGEAVIGPATSGIDMSFIESCFKNGALGEWDAVSVHPYRQNEPESAAPEYAALRQSIRAHAGSGREIPIISGEWGYSAAWKDFDEDRQGRMLAREFLTNLSQNVPLSIWYDWRDDGPDPKEPEHHFGTVGLPRMQDGKNFFPVKPAYRAARTLTTTLAGYHFLNRLALGDDHDRALLFGNGRDLVIACWTTSGKARSARFPSGDANCRMLGHLGDAITPPAAENGWINVTLDAAPKYLRFDRIVEKLTAFPSPPAFTCDLVRLPGGRYLALVENPTGDAFSGTVQLTGAGHDASAALVLAKGETTRQIGFSTHDSDASTPEAGLDIRRADHKVMVLPARRRGLGNPALLADAEARGDGDSKAVSTQTITPATDSPPGFAAPVWEVTCRFEPGWRFSTINLKSQSIIAGNPESFGLWVFGDASGVALRMRVIDANGRVWQPDGGTVTWKGWHHIQLPLGPGTAHWGGQGDSVIRYPLKWDAPVLIDNISRQTLQTRLLITAPTLGE